MKRGIKMRNGSGGVTDGEKRMDAIERERRTRDSCEVE